jgi:hypothetical protein
VVTSDSSTSGDPRGIPCRSLVALAHKVPFAGMIRIRFDGCALSRTTDQPVVGTPTSAGPPVKERVLNGTAVGRRPRPGEDRWIVKGSCAGLGRHRDEQNLRSKHATLGHDIESGIDQRLDAGRCRQRPRLQKPARPVPTCGWMVQPPQN